MQFSIIVLGLVCVQTVASNRDRRWTYDGISGPTSWGQINEQWKICNIGKRQSPINIVTGNLLFDPHLGDLQVSVKEVDGILRNTGQHLVFNVAKECEEVSVTGGPLSYNYRFEKIVFHYGSNDTLGSEHQINGKHFPLEMQIYAYNKDLYHNISKALHRPKGIAAISVMVRVGESSPALQPITSSLSKVVHKDKSHQIRNLNINSLLPRTREYVTYEGSYTEPGCWESVIWIIYNKPIYISAQEMYAFRKLVQGTEESPRLPLSDNTRPVQPSHLTVLTNIKPTRETVTGKMRTLRPKHQKTAK